MHKKIFLLGLLLMAKLQLNAQTAPFDIVIEPMSISGISGLQAYSFGQDKGKWLIVGGRLDGLHRRQPFAAFDVAGNNNQIVVVDPTTQRKWTYQMMRCYPQLMPFSGQKAPFKLYLNGLDDELVQSLRQCNIDEKAPVSESAKANIHLTVKGTKKTIRYWVQDAQGKLLVPEQRFSYTNSQQAGKELAYRLCGIGGINPNGKL